MLCWTTSAAAAVAAAVPAGRRSSIAIASPCAIACSLHMQSARAHVFRSGTNVGASVSPNVRELRGRPIRVLARQMGDMGWRRPWIQQKRADLPVQVCPPATREDIQRFQAAMTVCFRRAVDAGLSIAVSPRLDDGLGIGGWRNGAQPAQPTVDLQHLEVRSPSHSVAHTVRSECRAHSQHEQQSHSSSNP